MGYIKISKKKKKTFPRLEDISGKVKNKTKQKLLKNNKKNKTKTKTKYKHWEKY